MKFRVGFVSNSSDSSFIINKKKLTQVQIDMLYDHIKYGKRLAFLNATKEQLEDFEKEGNFCSDYGYFKRMEDNKWHIEEDGDEMHIETSMDNFDLEHFLYYEVKISKDAIIHADGQNNELF